MANTYTQIYVQLIFSVKRRENLISEEIREAVQKYICGIIKKKKSKPMAIYCNPDHTHILISLHPAISISEIVSSIKSNSAKWINEQKLTSARFQWQSGFGAFSYSKSQVARVIDYILNQREHHKKKKFRDEFLGILNKRQVEYREDYLFDWIDDSPKDP